MQREGYKSVNVKREMRGQCKEWQGKWRYLEGQLQDKGEHGEVQKGYEGLAIENELALD